MKSVTKDSRLLRVGVLGAGPIAQVAHLEACRRARNTELYAICDLASDLTARMAAIHQPRKTCQNLDEMLADPQVEAVIVATADAFHVSLSTQVLRAGKHLFVEKPLGLVLAECRMLARLAGQCGLRCQVGFNRRFDPALAFTHEFVRDEMGPPRILNAWYCDSVDRYAMTDNLQAIPYVSTQARKPAADPKADKRRYFLLTHGSHLFDTARFLGGPLTAVDARFQESAGSYLWSITVEFTNGCFGHLNLVVPAHGDFEEGFQIFGDHGSAAGRLHLPWYRKAGQVECFSTRDRVYRRPLGADADTYKLQLESFAAGILGTPASHGATLEDGVENLRALIATARSTETRQRVELKEVSGSV